MIIMGLNFNHDGSAAIVKDGILVGAILTERITRNKKQRGVPREVVKYLLKKADLQLSDIDAFAVCSWQGDVQHGSQDSIYNKHADGWYALDSNDTLIDNSVWQHYLRGNYLARAKMHYAGIERPLFFVNHHLAHCAYSFYSSPFDKAVSLSIDVCDEFCASSGVVDFSDDEWHLLKNDSDFLAGRLYSDACDFLGFWPALVGAGKVMALASYGIPFPEYKDFVWPRAGLFSNMLKELLSACGYSLPAITRFCPPLPGEGGTVDRKWLAKENWRDSRTTNLAATIQKILEESLLAYIKEIRKRTKHDALCLSGGTLLNCVATGKIIESGIFENVFNAPACGDDGTSIGAAYITHSFLTKSTKVSVKNLAVFEGGIRYTKDDIEFDLQVSEKELHKSNVEVFVLSDDDVASIASDKIIEGKIVGWFYRGSEVGPRALGHRSILADPRRVDMKDILNSRVKHREPFRPFAPVVLKECAEDWFDTRGRESPFMLVSMLCKQPSLIPAVCHVDDSSRIQTVDAENNARYYDVVKNFYDKTGIPCVVNTSFNVQGEPIVETPLDAIRCFLSTEIDVLFIENYMLIKPAK